MTDKELIKQEIEKEIGNIKRYIYHPSLAGHSKRDMTVVYETLNKLLRFINSLPEESDCEKKDYRERYEKLTQSDTFKSSYCDKSLGKEESTDEANCTTKSDDLEEAASKYIEEDFHERSRADFKAGAEWQKQKDQQTIELAEDHAMLAGIMKEREEMMKNAVELHIIESFNPVGNENEKPHGFTALCYNAKYPDFYPITGQTIKVVPIKEIQKKMSKIAEQKALEIYPDIEINWTMTDRTKERMIYADGYDQAIKDFLEKANEFFHEQFNIHPHDCHVVQYVSDTPLDDIDDFVEQFKNYMQDE